MSATTADAAAHPHAEHVAWRPTRRTLQLALAGLWLLDAALQYQPYMFGPGFAHDIIAPAGQGQPAPVKAGVDWAATLIAANPVAWNAVFATVQLALALALLWQPTIRAALAASILWSLSIWYLGEGLGAITSGHADALTGAPGAVLLYALIAALAWPPAPPGTTGWRRWTAPATAAPPTRFTPATWTILWIGAATLRALPGQDTATALAGELTGNAEGAPAWLATADHHAAAFITGTGIIIIAALIAVELAIGVAALFPGKPRTYAAWAGILLATAFWIFGQNLGEIYTGQATDPNTAPLIALLAVTLIATGPRRQHARTTPMSQRDPSGGDHRPVT